MSKSTGGQLPQVNKSVGGRGPIRTKIHTITYQSSHSTEYISVFKSPTDKPTLPPLFSFQIYVTIAVPDSQKEKLCVDLYETITLKQDKPSVPTWRFDVHFLPGSSKDECITHYRLDKEARKEVPLCVMSSYKDESVTTGGVFVLVDQEHWEENGVGFLYFDRDMKFLKEGQAPGEPEPESEKYFEKVPLCSPEGGWTRGTPSPVDRRFWDLYSMGPNEFLEEMLEEAWEEGRQEW
ncbi:hypothetical protein IFR05_009377 [Cadophora sp. M221]|nr:hypothetical protein IFR05_009377 [Cadophora sp. M221]